MVTDAPQDALQRSLDDLIKSSGEKDGDFIRRAFELARKAHEKQTRHSGEPYITHPLAVAQLLADLRLDQQTIAAGLLHDILEDTPVTYDILKAKFDATVADLVQGVTKLTKLEFATEGEHQGENLRKLILAMARDIRVVVIKLCDRLHNMRTLRWLPVDRRLAVARETLAIYSPLAHRLGMTRIRVELEDLAMFWLNPEDYRFIQLSINKRKQEREGLIEETKEFLSMFLRAQYPNIEIQGRSKHYYSIWRKMKTQGLSFEELYDLNAVRVICDNEQQCYEILGTIHGTFPPLPNRFKDYIALPKANMYQSLHTTVLGLHGEVTEIQIRTRRMHAIAEEGIAAHWRYKEGAAGGSKLDERLQWLRKAMEWLTDLKKPSEFLEAMKKDVFADVVICFTPRGDLIELPSGATPLDFAYAIHSQVGEHCVGARVNRKQIPVNTPLYTGDVVEIQNLNTGHPSRDWLDIVVTSRARAKIKRWLKDKEFDIWAAAGRESVGQALRARGVEIPKEDLNKALEKLVIAHRLSGIDDLYCEIGFGSISAQKALNQVLPPVARKKQAPKRPATPGVNEVIIEGGYGIPVRRAACCAPKAGDEIVGFVSRGRGVMVHKMTCPNIVRMRSRGDNDASRLLHAHWGSAELDEYKIMNINLVAHDHTGLLNKVSGLITENGVFITSCTSRSNIKKQTACMNFTVRVRDMKTLDKIVKQIRKMPAILEIATKSKNKARQAGAPAREKKQPAPPHGIARKIG